MQSAVIMLFGFRKDRMCVVISGESLREFLAMVEQKLDTFARLILGKRCQQQFWQITTDIETLPDNSTWYVMTYIPGVKYKEIGNLFGIRTWVEYGLKQSKNELGWADFRVTNYAQIEKWWEIVMSSYLMVSLHSDRLNKSLSSIPDKFQEHELWDFKQGWKNLLNNLHLIIQPFI